ncbi:MULTISPECIES: hypothetical protein [Marivita]|uniref:Uncharacterized protein n=1 Tax=Marivita cryptomonadis TaxID=505252 RepID=A0A9Q2NV84_9RHOB|nr:MULTISPECIES: hypothetical protein [Marivita]MCR9169858.1 hypothetical protein [Paracoccaceae bacterium]MBM2323485.1 hypothetical protein [Marivita cryptomonadis]MBM2333071.1 hypothetical protein [Marivita cryptomonadis]MBM2342651.1 hypothetical protein [Marivita cryptomonadis]MBM2347319.1 hypothetical protein [Marivita cryptomonadis]
MIRIAAILIVCSLVAGCASDPLSGVPRLSETDVTDSDIQAALRSDADIVDDAGVAPEAKPTGFFGRLFGVGDGASQPAVAEAAADVDATIVESENADATAEVPQPASEPAPRRGLLGFLSRAAQTAQADDGTQLAAAPPQTQSDAAPAVEIARARGPKPDAPDYRIVPMGTALPYGVLARVCDVPDRQLGTRVERYPESRSVYALYDSQPGNTAPHTFYVTGFDDGCARQFTAALALFGSPETHEQLRYGLPSKVQPYSSTDAAYETLKSRVCRVGKGKPCGSSMSQLARTTAFVSVYETFGSNPEWKTILLHDGEVVETDIRSN